ncbi:MAG TPA: hypothetical protein VG603_02380 [Chitinophagales bacterium]|nr:hypothetical protein [Chitinophagales bacterium]
MSYINQLPGITITDFDKAINNEHSNALARINDLYDLAIQNVASDVQSAIAGKYELKTFIENEVIGYYWENKNVRAAIANSKTGIQARLTISPYMKFKVHRIRLFLNYTGNVTVEAWDLIQGVKLNEVTVAVTDGVISETLVDWEFATKKQRIDLFFGYHSDFPSYQTNITAYKDDSTVVPWLNSWIFFRGCSLPDGYAPLYKNLNGNSGTSGISMDYSLQCSFDEKLCNIKNMLAQPLLYKLGWLIMKEIKHSKRLNGVVVGFSKDHDELMHEYEAQYTNQMNQLFRNLAMPRDLCFSCDQRVKSQVILP